MLARGLIGRFEGCHRVGSDGLIWPYVCPAGYWTQGWGRRVWVGAPPKDRTAINLWFLEDCLKYEDIALRVSPILHSASEWRRAAITSFCYNLGEGNYRASTLRKRINEGDWTAAQQEIKRWVYGGGKVLPGLVIRRAFEARYLSYGD